MYPKTDTRFVSSKLSIQCRGDVFQQVVSDFLSSCVKTKRASVPKKCNKMMAVHRGRKSDVKRTTKSNAPTADYWRRYGASSRYCRFKSQLGHSPHVAIDAPTLA